jgi:hypothetical protein
MLALFSTKNFRSFRDEATLDLRAPGGRAPGAEPWDGNLQAVAAIYGANASGKTTLFDAIAAMSAQVEDSYKQSATRAEPFAFDPRSSEEPTEFKATFVAADGVCYAYGFEVLDGRVTAEWADRYATARSTTLFQRDASGFRFGVALKGPNRAVEKITPPSSLYLSAAAAAGHPALAPLSEWLTDRLRCFSAGGHRLFFEHVVAQLAEDPARARRVERMLSRSDLGVDGLRVAVEEWSPKEAAANERTAAALGALLGLDAAPRPPKRKHTAFGEHAVGGEVYQLPFESESEGTKATLCHAFVADQALAKGTTVVFDELDTSLHPLLVRRLVAAFQDRESNPKQAQLIFTTHDVSLMDAGHLGGSQVSRDEVWVVDRTPDLASTLTGRQVAHPGTRASASRCFSMPRTSQTSLATQSGFSGVP